MSGYYVVAIKHVISHRGSQSFFACSNCLPVLGDAPWCSETLTLKCLKVLPMDEALELLHVKL